MSVLKIDIKHGEMVANKGLSAFWQLPTLGYHIQTAHVNTKTMMKYRKFPKYSDTQKMCCNHSKIWTMWLYHRVMSPNDADGIANSVDPDQTAPLGAVWSGSALFAQACLSENLGSLWYIIASHKIYIIWASSRGNLSLVIFNQVRLKPACEPQTLTRILKFWR